MLSRTQEKCSIDKWVPIINSHPSFTQAAIHTVHSVIREVVQYCIFDASNISFLVGIILRLEKQNHIYSSSNLLFNRINLLKKEIRRSLRADSTTCRSHSSLFIMRTEWVNVTFPANLLVSKHIFNQIRLLSLTSPPINLFKNSLCR